MAKETKQPLSPSEIKQLLELIEKVFEYITELHRTPPGDKIQYPKLPPSLTESLGVYLLRRGFLSNLGDYHFALGGNKADIIATKGNDTKKIEVKGTTKSFEHFGDKDIKADYLLWFDFQNLRDPKKTDLFDLYMVSTPIQYFSKPGRIMLPKLRKIVGTDLVSKQFSISTLLDQITSDSG